MINLTGPGARPRHEPFKISDRTPYPVFQRSATASGPDVRLGCPGGAPYRGSALPRCTIAGTLC